MTGKELEKLVLEAAALYEEHGWLTLDKTDPPVSIVGPPRAKRVTFKDNPWLDFAGSWTKRGGQAIVIEAKVSDEASLPVGGDKGITEKQVRSLRRWTRAGAAVGVIWVRRGEFLWVDPATVEYVLAIGERKSIPCEGLFKIRRVPAVGHRELMLHFAEALAHTYPDQIKEKA